MGHEKVVSITSAFNMACVALIQIRSRQKPTRMEDAFRTAIIGSPTEKQRGDYEKRQT